MTDDKETEYMYRISECFVRIALKQEEIKKIHSEIIQVINLWRLDR